MKNEADKGKRLSPWRNVIAGAVTVALITSSILLITSRKRDFSDAFILPPHIIDFSKTGSGQTDKSLPLQQSFSPQRYKNKLFDSAKKKESPNNVFGLELTSGDIIGENTGGRPTAPDGSTVYGEDQRAWFDARVPLLQSDNFKFYGAGTLGWDTAHLGQAGDIFAPENLSYGGGFGLSFKLSENAELMLDYRLSRPADSEGSVYDVTNAAGFSIKLSF